MDEVKFIKIPQWFYDELPSEIKNRSFFYYVTNNEMDDNGNIIKDPIMIEKLNKIKEKYKK